VRYSSAEKRFGGQLIAEAHASVTESKRSEDEAVMNYASHGEAIACTAALESMPSRAGSQTVSTSAAASSSQLSNMELIELCRTYGYLVQVRSRRVLRNHHLCEDVVQNVFVKLMRHGAGIREARSKLAYLYAITDRCCIDVLRSWRRDRGLLQREAVEADTGEAPAAPYEQRDALCRLLDLLEPFDRLVALELSDGLTQEEIAQRLSCSRQTVNKKVGAIRRLLQELQ
jgi:RNA polymerase sigma factor (sigma-70 family)